MTAQLPRNAIRRRHIGLVEKQTKTAVANYRYIDTYTLAVVNTPFTWWRWLDELVSIVERSTNARRASVMNTCKFKHV